ncbi:MAG: sel1 repeat family protein [Deltaproteobacteria bacterium]|nr:sel1 repeat family protein [Deltaproteobacteria bacterium]
MKNSLSKAIHLPSAVSLGLLTLLLVLFAPIMAWAQEQPTSTPQETTTVGPEAASESRVMTIAELIDVLTQEADKKNPRAMLTLGMLYERGYPQIRNYGKALNWYQKAAELDLAEAYFNVGVCYEFGMGTAPDFKKALDSYLLASKKGLAQADFKLASLYLNGQEVPVDTEKGLKYLNAAADQGLTAAIKEQGALYYFGNLGTTRDLTKALEIFTKAAEAGDPEAMKNVGIMYSSGEGVGANKTIGLKWYLLAQRFGFQNEAMDNSINELKSGLTEAQIKTAETEANVWAEQFQAAQEARAAAAQEAAAVQPPAAPAAPAKPATPPKKK